MSALRGRALPGGRASRVVLARYLAVLTAANLAWEVAQLPLYTIGQTGTPGEIAFAVLHCTAGDALIGGAAMLGALALATLAGWPATGGARVLATAVLIGLAYTVLSEWVNVELRGSWAYSALMPRVPPLGTGLAPMLQWLVLPLLAWAATVGPTRVGRKGGILTEIKALDRQRTEFPATAPMPRRRRHHPMTNGDFR